MPTLLTQAVLFDLDGTLVDSTASVDRSWHHIAQLMRRDPAEIVGKYHGMPGNLILQLVDLQLSAKVASGSSTRLCWTSKQVTPPTSRRYPAPTPR